MAVSILFFILIFYFGLVTVQGYICVNRHQFHSQSNAECADSSSQCKFRQDDLIDKENNDHVNPEVLLPTTDYRVGNGDFSNGVTEKGSETSSSSESNNERNSNPNVDLQNVTQVNLYANSTVLEFVTDVNDVVAYNDDMSKKEMHTRLTKQSNAIALSDIKDIKKQIKCDRHSVVKCQSTNDLKMNCDDDNSESSMSDTENTLNNSESKETPISTNVTTQLNNNLQNALIILNNQQTTILLVTNSLDNIRRNEYSKQSKEFFVNMQHLNPQVSPINAIGVLNGYIVNLNSETTSYALVTVPSDGNGNYEVNSGTLYTLNNVPISFVQVSNGEYGVPNTVQSYYTIQLGDGKTILVPNNNGQSLMSGNGLVKLVPLDNLQASGVRMQNIPAFSQAGIQVLADRQQIMPPRVFQVPLNNLVM